MSYTEKLPPDQVNKHLIELMPVWQDQLLEAAIFFPICLFLAMCAIYCFVLTVVNWRGHMERVLLLKLVDMQQNHSNDSGHTT